jgi:TRAP-type uncharacterized transport system fused permease subunit
VLEATRRCTGWIMPAVAIAFLLYAFFGNYLPQPWTHRGYDAERLIPHLAITLEGIFGTAVGCERHARSSCSPSMAPSSGHGAGKFFVDFSFAATGGKPSSAGRTVVLSAFLLGRPSGSGVATTVTDRHGGLADDEARGLHAARCGRVAGGGRAGRHHLAAHHGRAAFLIAEYLRSPISTCC